MTRRNRRLLVRVALAAAVAFLMIYRYTSPKTLFQEANSPARSGEARR